MIPCQTHLTDSVATRYALVAGPFADEEKPLWDRILAHFRETSARVVTVLEPEGPCIRRLRSETETVEETAARLGRPLTSD